MDQDKIVLADQDEVNNGKVYAILAYLSILFLIGLFAAKDNKFVQYHVNQGLVLFLANVVVVIIGRIPLVGLLYWPLSVATTVFMILGIVNAAKGLVKPLPLIGTITIVQSY